MNAGFEDCSILSKLLNKHRQDFNAALSEFSATRWEDAHAISDLAMYNYKEVRRLRMCGLMIFIVLCLMDFVSFYVSIQMRDLVNRKSYRLRKSLDDILFWLMPTVWVPLYNSVSFTHMPYKKCIENREWQDKVKTRMPNNVFADEHDFSSNFYWFPDFIQGHWRRNNCGRHFKCFNCGIHVYWALNFIRFE